MNPIQKFEITGMTVSGFKCFAGSEEIEFGSQTIITGGNGRGKSSVADAIAFAVTGLPFFGERGIDRLHAEQNADLFISMRFKDGNGAAHELTRSRKKDRMTITCDGREIRQADLTEMFGEKDVFLSILNPLYFIEELGDNGKKLLERYLPDVPQESVMPLLNNDTRTLLESEKIFSPGSFLSQCRAEIRDLEQSVVYTTGQKDLAESQRRDAAAKVRELTERLTALEKERGALETRRFEGIDLADAKDRLVDLSACYEEMAKETPETAGTAEIDGELREARDKLAARGAEQYVPKYAGHIAEHSAKVQEAGARYKRESGLLKGFQAGTVCPMCRRGVTENELPELRGELQKSVDAIVAEGKAATAKLEELKELERKSEETFRKFQAEDVEKLNAEIRRLTKQRDDSLAATATYQEQRKTEMERILAEIRGLSATTECGNLTPEESERLLACEEEIKACNTELTAARLLSEAAPEDFDLKIHAIQDQITEKKKLLAAVAQYVGKRAELLFSKLEMNRVKISLYDVVKSTGEVKDVFKFTYNGRRYDRLSLSEKIRAGMEVSELMKRLTGRNYPQFIDNMESVDDLANVRPTGQVIMAKCVRGAELLIRAAGGPKREMQSAA